MAGSFVRREIFAVILWLSGNLIAGCKNPGAHGKTIPFDHLVDLTYTLTPEFPYIPVHKLTFPFSMTPIATMAKNGVAANSWHIHEHLGTHIDAPNHFALNGISVDQIKPEDLIVPVVVIDMIQKASRDKDAELTMEDIKRFEDKYGRIPEHSCVMMLSGWEKFVKTPAYLGLDSQGIKHFPGFSPAAADFLVKERDIAGIGVDVISFDPGKDSAYSTHKLLLRQGKWGIENIANLSKIPITGATIIVGASKIGGATGGIARIFAVW
ncbi:MAG TPA: cyclase family protein [Puia sp.]|nr:cyclase family protein [Puia sp.]